MLKKIIYTSLLLMCLAALCACSDSDDNDDLATIRSNDLRIARSGDATDICVYEQGKTSFTEILPGGSTKACFCQRLAFRSAQALLTDKSFSAHYPDGIPADDIRIVTKWNTDGAEELFVDNLEWAHDDVRIKLDASDHNQLTYEDAVFYFVPRNMETAWKVSAQATLFPADFFTLRTAAKTGGAEEQAAFSPVKKDAMENYLRPVPLEDAFKVEEISPSSENLQESLAVFAGWGGTWVSSDSYIDDSAMNPAYEAVASAASAHSSDDVKAFVASMYRSDFEMMEISGETITWHEADAISGATVSTATCEYESAGTETVPWGEYEVEWNKFESVSQTCEGYRRIIFTAVHSHGDLSHWHMRYGDSGFDELMNYPDPMWWPTLFTDGTPVEKVAEDMIEEADELAMMLPSKIEETLGVMVIAHGSDEAEWNEVVQAAVDDVDLPYPVALGFLEFTNPDISAAAKSLEDQNVSKIIAVPLFICSYSNHIEEIRYVLGLRDMLPETEEVTEHGADAGEEEETLIPIESNAEIVLTPAIDDASAVAGILSGHIESISTQPDQEIAVLVGHGGDSPECLEKWNQNFASLASQVKSKLGLKDATYGFVAMGEPAIADVVAQAQEDGDVLVVPVMLSKGYFVQVNIPQALEGLNYRYADKALLPNPAIATLIEDRVNELLGDQ